MKKQFLFLVLLGLLCSVGASWGVNDVTLVSSNFTQWKSGATPPENSGLSSSNTYTMTDGTNDVADVVGQGCKLNDTKNTPTSTGITGYNTNKFRFGSSDNYLNITPKNKFYSGGKVRILVSAEKTSTEAVLGTVKIGETSLGTIYGWSAKATCDWQEFDIPSSVTNTTATITITRTDNTLFLWGVTILTNASSITVTYNANGGSGSMADGTGASVTLADNDFTEPTGYSFDSWNTANDGSGTAYNPDDVVTTSLNLYATWTQTVTLNANTANHGSGENSSATATLNATSLGDDFSPTSAAGGYRLVGYYSAATSGVKVLNADGTYADEDVTGYITSGKWTKSGATVLYAQMEEIVNYTVTLNPNGGTIDNATGWILDEGQYKKTVVSGTELALPTFTKEDRSFMTWRDGSDNEHESPITVSGNLTITAIWGKEKTTTIYSWESPEGTPIESGGTATSEGDGGTTNLNVSNSGYYTMRLNGESDYSGAYIKITPNKSVKTGDEIYVTAYYTKNSNKDQKYKINSKEGTEIAVSSNLVNIYGGANSPRLDTHTVPSDIETDFIKLTRTPQNTSPFITKIQIKRTEIIEEQDPCQTPTITAQPADADYEWDDDISALTVTASVTDGGTLSYQWYKKGTPNIEVGTNSSSYTPSVAGTYFVVVTNSKDGYDDTSATSDDAVITIAPKPKYTITFDPNNGGSTTGVEVTHGEAVASIASPVKSGSIFAGWQKAGVDYDFSTAVTSAFTLTATWTDVDENHFVYDYQDKFHYDGVVYKTPEGAVDAGSGTSNISMTTPYTLFSGTEGITSVTVTKGIYDSKTGNIQYVTSLVKLNNSNDSYLTVTIATGYIATMTIKCSGYGATRSVTFSDAIPNSSTTTGKAVDNNSNTMGTLTFTLAPGEHTLKVTGGTLYISNIDIQASQTVTATIGTTGWATFSSCAPLDFTGKTVKAYKVTGVDGSNVVVVTQVNKVPANTGLLLNGTTDDIPVATGDMDDMSYNLMVAGDGSSVAASETRYVLANQDDVLGFYKIASAIAVPYGKAYLDVTSLGYAPSIIRIVDEENNATNIENVEANEKATKFIENGRILIKKNGIVYDALGRVIR